MIDNDAQDSNKVAPAEPSTLTVDANAALIQALGILARNENDKMEEKVAAKADHKFRMEKAQQSLKQDNDSARFRQQRCSHYKGGKGTEAIVHGEGDRADNPCVGLIKLPTGKWVTMCTRCFKTTQSGDKDHQKMLRLAKKSNNSPSECMQLSISILSKIEMEERDAELLKNSE